MNRIIPLLTFLFFEIFSLTAQDRCDPSLPQVPNNPLSYQDLGDRCEGIFVQPLGSSTLRVVSFTKFFENYNLGSTKPLQVTWDNLHGKNVVRLRASGTKRKLYYRMDTYCSPDKKLFNWPANILASLDILKSDIGVVAYTKYLIDGKERDVYLPLIISQQKETEINSTYKLSLLPGVELSEIYISIRQLNADGTPGQFIKQGVKLDYGYYPAERPIDIPISGLKEKGIYFFEGGATLRNGGTSTVAIWFYYQG